MIFAFVDMINRDWKEIEAALDKIPLKVEGHALSVERHGERMRLLYNGKPPEEHKTADKIEAVKHLPVFYEDYIENQRLVSQEARQATIEIAKWVGHFQLLKRSQDAPASSETSSDRQHESPQRESPVEGS